jgi:DNA polymerase III epsilon subunit-like protein
MLPNNYLVVDLEYTNKVPLLAELLTGHFLLVDESLHIVDEYSLQVKPRIWDDEADKAAEIHNIGYDKAKHFPEFSKAMGDFKDWLADIPKCFWVSHSNRTIFRAAGNLSTNDYQVLATSLFDLNSAHYVLYSKCPTRYILSTHSMASYLKLPCSLDLEGIVNHYKIGSFKHHDAREDTLVTYKIFKNLIANINVEEFLDYENFRLRPEVLNDRQVTTRPKKIPRKLQRDTTLLI